MPVNGDGGVVGAVAAIPVSVTEFVLEEVALDVVLGPEGAVVVTVVEDKIVVPVPCKHYLEDQSAVYLDST